MIRNFWIFVGALLVATFAFHLWRLRRLLLRTVRLPARRLRCRCQLNEQVEASNHNGVRPEPQLVYHSRMEMEVRQVSDVVVLDLTGRMAAGVSDDMLPQAMDVLLSDGYRKIVINLASVDYIDSMGLGELVHACRTARDQGAMVKLLKPQDRVRKTLQLTNVLTLFGVFETEDDAVASFKAAPKPVKTN